jgi:hypothetical protein
VGAVRNADLVKEYYPEFDAWYYIGRSVPENIINELESRPWVKVIRMDGEENQTATMWRFFAADEPEVKMLLSRDTDSRIRPREVAAVRDWIASDREFHVMRDHPWHNVPILSGMLGARGESLNRLGKWSKIWYRAYSRDFYQTDQIFLASSIYETVRQSILAHDEFFHFESDLPGSRRDWPVPRIGGEFACQAYDENEEILFPEHQWGAKGL